MRNLIFPKRSSSLTGSTPKFRNCITDVNLSLVITDLKSFDTIDPETNKTCMFAWKQAPYVKLILETASCLWQLYIFKCLKHFSFSGVREEFKTFLAYAFDLVTSSFKSWLVMNKLKKNNGLSVAVTSIFIPLFSLNWNIFKTGLALDQLSFELPLFSSPSLELSSARLLYYLLHQNLDLLDFIICPRWVITWKVTII